MLSALIFYTLLFSALVLTPAALILVVLLVLNHERRLRQSVRPAFESIGGMIARAPVVVGFWKRFPRTAGFVGLRFDSRNPWGLTATVASLAILLGLWFFLGVLEDISARDPLVILDLRLHNAVPLFRTAGMTRLMLALTALASGTVLSLLCVGAALIAIARNRPRLAATFVLALLGTGLISSALKALFGYARPVDGMIAALDASFPSGHVLSGSVVYGLLAALLLRSRLRAGLRAICVTLLLLVIVGIGLSRVYLGVHWPSDILGSLALALVVLALLLFFQYYAAPVRWVDTLRLPTSTRAFNVVGVILLLAALGAIPVLSTQTKILPIGPLPPAQTLDIAALRSSLPPNLPRWSEDLIGGRMEPISLVFIGAEKDLLSAFTRAEWTRADLPTPLRVIQEGLAALRNLPDPSGPATPAFFGDRPQYLTFEKPDAGPPTIRRRHHARVWLTRYCLAPDCRPVWVATASYDMGIRFSESFYFPTHRIDPAIDAERAIIVSDLTSVGARQEARVTVSAPLRGTNAAGDPFWTDGHALVLVLP